MQPTKKIDHRLLAEGRVQEAMALQAAVTHNVWCASRATDDPLFMQCPRCGHDKETLLHRHWTCPDLNNCVHPAVRGAQHLIPRTVDGVEDNAAFWLGCVLTGKMVNPQVGLVPLRGCITHVEGNFADILKSTGVDGSGGKKQQRP